MSEQTDRKRYEAPRVIGTHTWSELLAELGPAHALYELPENP